MRPSSLVLFILMSFLISEVQGTRLNKEFLSVGHHKIHEDTVIKPRNGGVGEAFHCKDGHCSGSNRKLMNKATSNPTTTIAKNDNIEGTNEGSNISKGKLNTGGHNGDKDSSSFSVNSSPVSDHRKASPEQYPDILDIAGMDYSPARRKPPIHN